VDWEISVSIELGVSSKFGIDRYRCNFLVTLKSIDASFEKFRISEALLNIYKLLWDDYSSWFLEMIKPEYQQPIDSKTYNAVIEILEDNLKVLHPFMPFLTEEIWHYISERTPEEALIISTYPKAETINNSIIEEFSVAAEVISGIRAIRKDKNIAFKNAVGFSVLNNEKLNSNFDSVIQKLGNLTDVNYVDSKVEGALSFRVKSNEYFIPFGDEIDVVAEKEKLEEELKYTKGFLMSVQKKLSNERFVNNAPDQVITNERKKEADALAKIETLETSLKSLG
jgi:valyl-tRNA synthetase